MNESFFIARVGWFFPTCLTHVVFGRYMRPGCWRDPSDSFQAPTRTDVRTRVSVDYPSPVRMNFLKTLTLLLLLVVAVLSAPQPQVGHAGHGHRVTPHHAGSHAAAHRARDHQRISGFKRLQS
ncbi:Nuclear receptor corepressor 2 [Frankliniella fusca]|uniref:Nuclear receptor corepressor 2 n=1 Tax=Frankliniella fusca TaxID=407009 RepID=A0AAE1I4X3_9NEOP|nr:Nuclear receptor corepressor 2 [Frankliniella fusca]